MVRKVIAILLSTLLLLCVAAATASAEAVYEGTISTTFTSFAEKIILLPGDDYVFYRSSQYTYTLLTGDLDYSNNIFTLNETGKVYVITQVNGSYGSANYYQYSVSEVDTYSVEASDKLVYSNLGGYPSLHDNADVYTFVMMILLCIVCLCALVRPVFNYLMRNRKGSV